VGDGETVVWMATLSLAKDRLGDISLRLTNNNLTLPKCNKFSKEVHAVWNYPDLPSSPVLLKPVPCQCANSHMPSNIGYERNNETKYPIPHAL